MKKSYFAKLCLLVFCLIHYSCNHENTLIDWSPLELNYARTFVLEERSNERHTVIRLELAENDFDAPDNKIFRFDIYNRAGIDTLVMYANQRISYKIETYGDILSGRIDAVTGLPKGAFFQRISNHSIVYEELIPAVGGRGYTLSVTDFRFAGIDDRDYSHQVFGWFPFYDRRIVVTATIWFYGDVKNLNAPTND